jgi:hypothetical protein
LETAPLSSSCRHPPTTQRGDADTDPFPTRSPGHRCRRAGGGGGPAPPHSPLPPLPPLFLPSSATTHHASRYPRPPISSSPGGRARLRRHRLLLQDSALPWWPPLLPSPSFSMLSRLMPLPPSPLPSGCWDRACVRLPPSLCRPPVFLWYLRRRWRGPFLSRRRGRPASCAWHLLYEEHVWFEDRWRVTSLCDE